MSPDEVSRHPGFLPYAHHRDELLGLATAQWVARCNVLAAQRDLRSGAGAPIRFVIGGAPLDALGYEAAILHEGRIACRPEGRGALHDLHNALAWLVFPGIKATLNRLHLARAELGGLRGRRESAARREAGRGRVRDLATLLDESGMLWVSTSRLLDEQLSARNWRELLVSNRERVRAEVLPIIIGHGLLEKLAAPYKSMTAHCLICPRPGSPGATVDLTVVDAEVAGEIATAFAAQTPPVFAPLPIMGLPGWDPGNIDASYYDDARVFRTPGQQSAE